MTQTTPNARALDRDKREVVRIRLWPVSNDKNASRKTDTWTKLLPKLVLDLIFVSCSVPPRQTLGLHAAHVRTEGMQIAGYS